MRRERVFKTRPLRGMVVVVLGGLAVLAAGGRAFGDTPLLVQQGKLFSELSLEFQFAGPAAISGDTVVQGATAFFDSPNSPGAAYVFVKSGAGWSQQQKLTGSNVASPEGFGWSVAISGDTIVVGSPFEGGNTGLTLGAVYVFVRTGTSWSLQQRLTPTSQDNGFSSYFGFAVAISGDTMVVGHLGDFDGAFSDGTAYVFVRNGAGWSLQQKLIPSIRSGGFFGYSVALDGETALVGDPAYAAGSACVFARSGSIWTEQQKLAAGGATAGVNFGYAVAIAGGTLVVGDPYDDAAGNRAGSAYVFVKTAAGWSLEQKLIPPDRVPPGDPFGKTFGGAVAIRGDTILAGAQYDSYSGAAYVFGRSGASWKLQQKLTPCDAAGGSFGLSVALSGDTVAIGAGYGGSVGHTVYLFGPTPVFTAIPSLLWPPNREMVPVTLVADSIDSCDEAPSCAVENVTSNEPIAEDFSIDGSLQLGLRADRLGSGPGRTYSVVVGCRDALGNRSSTTADVFVPHDRATP